MATSCFGCSFEITPQVERWSLAVDDVVSGWYHAWTADGLVVFLFVDIVVMIWRFIHQQHGVSWGMNLFPMEDFDWKCHYNATETGYKPDGMRLKGLGKTMGQKMRFKEGSDKTKGERVSLCVSWSLTTSLIFGKKSLEQPLLIY